MSKTSLLDNVTAKMTGNRVVRDIPLTEIKFDETTLEVAWNYGTEYRIGVQIGSAIVIPEEESKKNPMLLEYEKERMKRGIAEVVYGEVRKELIELAIMLQESGYSYNDPNVKKVEEILNMITP